MCLKEEADVEEENDSNASDGGRDSIDSTRESVESVIVSEGEYGRKYERNDVLKTPQHGVNFSQI